MLTIKVYIDHIEWMKDRKVHREDGPAREWKINSAYCYTKDYYVHGLCGHLNVQSKTKSVT